MDRVFVAVTVMFEEPFWVLVFERTEDNKLSVCKVTVGAEPKDYEVQEFLLTHYCRLRFSPAVETAVKEVHMNPKRRQREVHKKVKDTGIGTKSQQALKLQQEEMKTYPFGLVWDYYCESCGVPVQEDWFEEIQSYEKDVLARRA